MRKVPLPHIGSASTVGGVGMKDSSIEDNQNQVPLPHMGSASTVEGVQG